MSVLRDALRGTFRGDLGIARGIRIVDARQKAVEGKVTGLFASGILLAEPAAYAADAADLADLRSLIRVVAENVHRGGSGNERDNPLRTDGDALAAADAKALINLRQTVDDRDRGLGAHVRAGAVPEAAVGAAFVAAGRRRRDAAVADSVVVADANRLGARSAALDYSDAPFRAGGVDSENVRNFSRSVGRYRGARSDGSRTRDKSAGVTVAPGKAAPAAVGAGQRGGNHADPGIFADAQIFIREGERNRRYETYGRDAYNCCQHFEILDERT